MQFARHSPPNSIGVTQAVADLVAPQYVPSYVVDVDLRRTIQKLNVIIAGEFAPIVSIFIPNPFQVHFELSYYQATLSAHYW